MKQKLVRLRHGSVFKFSHSGGFVIRRVTLLSTISLGLILPALAEPGLEFEQAQSTSGSRLAPNPKAQTSPLSLAELADLLRRLPALKALPGDRQDFSLREGSLPAPKAGQRVKESFPPPPSSLTPPTVEKKPVEVLRYAPEGEVELAPQVTVTFNQPMVDLASTKAVTSVPVEMSPQVEGEWRWLGTQTLIFKPKTRLPMATQYQLQVPGIDKPLHWSFATPAPKLQQQYPTSSGISLRPVLFLGFDQRVDAEVLAGRSLLQSSGGQRVMLRRATASEIALDDTVARMARDAQPDRWVALVPVSPLTAGTSYSVVVPAGTASLEGPRTTASDQSFGFTTYAPLAITNRPTSPLSPGAPLWVYFNNNLDPKKFHPEAIKVTPELPGMRVVVRGNALWVHGRTKGRTKYTLTLPASLTDSWGQNLGQEQTVEIEIGGASPMFVPPTKTFLLLDPSGPGQLMFRTVNHQKLQVRLRSVQPEDWKAYHEGLNHRWDQEKFLLPGKVVWEDEIPASQEQDVIADVKVDLTKALEESNQVLVEVCPSDLEASQKRYQTYYGWVQRSQLGANLVIDGNQLLCWVNGLADGKPVAGAEVSFLGGKGKVESRADGLAPLPWEGNEWAVLIRHGKDRLFVPRDANGYGSGFNPGRSADSILWYVTDDRKLYKPGEKVSVKGWLRRQLHQPKGGLSDAGQHKVHYILFDSRNNEVLRGETEVGGLGGFDFHLDLPKNFNLGTARLQLSSEGSQAQHTFQVEEFRRPEFEVSTQADTGSTVVGGQGTLSVDAKYYSGGGLKDAAVRWDVTSSPTNYSPPHWEEYTFGSWTPWWDCYCWWDQGTPVAVRSKTFEGRTNGQGHHSLDLQFRSVDPPRPQTVSATASVSDVNRQTWSSNASMLVHPSNYYVGIKSRSTFVEAGRPLEYQLVVCDLDGKAVSGRPIQVKAYRLGWEYDEEGYRTTKKEIFTQSLTSSSAPISLSVPTSEGGTYQLEALIQDDSNRSNQSQMTSWVSGGKQPPKRDVEMQQLTLVPNKKIYQPNDVAEILVQSPFPKAQALVTLERHGVVARQMLDLSTGSATLKVPLEEDYLPNLGVTVDVVGQEARTDAEGNPVAGAPPRPAQAQGSLNLSIDAHSRELQVQVRAAHPKCAPGSKNQLELAVKDQSGKPVADSEVALFVVDESVLALVGGDYANPWDLFYAMRPTEVVHQGVRQWIELALAKEIEVAQEMDRTAGMVMPCAAPPAPGGVLREEASGEQLKSGRALLAGNAQMADKKMASPRRQSPKTPIRVRKDFSALAYFLPRARTGGDGTVKLPFKLPDNLTRYRVVALAVAGQNYFGKGQSSLVAQQPLMVRPSPPRFLNFGDHCEVPVVVQNQTDQPLPVEIACRASNLKLDPKLAGVSLQVPANDRVEVRFPVSAEQAGRARLQFAVSSGDFADAAEIDFPVWTPATTEAFATYGVLDQGALVQAVKPPEDSFRQFGGLEVSTSSTALSELTDAFLYLRSYPYECAEQVSSRVLSTVALAPVLEAFGAPGLPSSAELKSSLEADVKKLQGMQNYDGGWDYWKRDRPSVPYVSLHVSHALVRLKKSGQSVPGSTLENALNYCSTIESHIPADYPDSCKRSLRAYALYVLRLAGRPDSNKARMLIGEFGGVEKVPFECLGWLLPTLSEDGSSKALVEQIRRHLNNRVSESASTAQFTTHYADGENLILASDHRDDAILLEALILDQPQSDLLPKLVRGLLDHRVAGRWASTQENCFVLLALQAYFERFEKVTPDFVARLWLGQRFAGEQHFRGRSADSKELRVPMAALDGRQDLILSKEGQGRLYYRLGMKYAPTNLDLKPLERGFTVERQYQAVDDNRDVRKSDDGLWHIKAGARVKVVVQFVAPTMRYHVALVDPLPAGLEPINPALKGSQPPTRPSYAARNRWWWSPWWYEHENLRDERVEAFSQWVWYGVHEYSYYARATTPGQYVAPPAKAEEMYHPETFGRSASDRVVVEP